VGAPVKKEKEKVPVLLSRGEQKKKRKKRKEARPPTPEPGTVTAPPLVSGKRPFKVGRRVQTNKERGGGKKGKKSTAKTWKGKKDSYSGKKKKRYFSTSWF